MRPVRARQHIQHAARLSPRQALRLALASALEQHRAELGQRDPSSSRMRVNRLELTVRDAIDGLRWSTSRRQRGMGRLGRVQMKPATEQSRAALDAVAHPCLHVVADGGLHANLIGFAAKLQGFAKVWAAKFGLGVVPRHLVVDSGGNLHLTGALTRNTNFNQAVPIVQAAGNGDMFIVKMHPNGLFQFAQSMGGTADALDGPPIAVGTGADIALAGTYNSSMMTLGTDPLPPVGKFGIRGIPSLFAARGDGAGSYPWMKTLSPKAMDGGFSGILVHSVGMDPRDQAVIIAGSSSVGWTSATG